MEISFNILDKKTFSILSLTFHNIVVCCYPLHFVTLHSQVSVFFLMYFAWQTIKKLHYWEVKRNGKFKYVNLNFLQMKM